MEKFLDGVTFDDPQAAFERAIAEGRLSDSPCDLNYAGRFMFMGTWNGEDHFKNSVTREYLRGKGR